LLCFPIPVLTGTPNWRAAPTLPLPWLRCHRGATRCHGDCTLNCNVCLSLSQVFPLWKAVGNNL